jgi:uncharacterized protein YicC (UPF0701 family)
MAELNLDDVAETVADTVRDAFYVSVGAGVIAFQKLQVQRQELTKAVTAQLDEARGTAKGSLDQAKGQVESVSELVEARVKVLEERLSGIESRLETVLAQIEEKLPEQARDLVKSARELVARAA